MLWSANRCTLTIKCDSLKRVAKEYETYANFPRRIRLFFNQLNRTQKKAFDFVVFASVLLSLTSLQNGRASILSELFKDVLFFLEHKFNENVHFTDTNSFQLITLKSIIFMKSSLKTHICRRYRYLLLLQLKYGT